MREHLGEEYAGTVSSAVSFGLFVTLDELHVEGLVHITELGGEYYHFDEIRQELRGERTGMRFAVGSRLRVQVSRVDLDGRKIDFRLVNDAAVDTALPRPTRKSGDELEEVERRDRVSKAKRATAVATRKRGGKPAAAPRKTKASRKKAV
jgi:ribonuclease R